MKPCSRVRDFQRRSNTILLTLLVASSLLRLNLPITTRRANLALSGSQTFKDRLLCLQSTGIKRGSSFHCVQAAEKTFFNASEIIPHETIFDENPELFAASEAFKLIFCYIPKNGCTKMKHLFLKLNAIRPEDEFESVHQTFYKSKSVHAVDMPKTSQLQAVNSDSWIRAVVLRDPLERFISAYVDKVVNEDVNLCWLGFCAGEAFTAEADSLLKFLSSQHVWENELHFRLQKYFCGFEQAAKTFFTDFFMYDATADLNQLTMNVFRGRVDFAIKAGWANDASMWQHITTHHTHQSSQYLATVSNVCSNHKLYQRLMNYLEDDYSFFNFPPPVMCS